MNAQARFVTFVPLVAIAALMALGPPQPWDAERWAGLVLAVVGFALLTVARLQLGNAFSVVPRARELVTRGLYARIRHPVYVFSALGLAGLALYFHVAKLLWLLIPLVIIQVLRARAEERVLAAHFGEAWQRYKQRTWF